MVKPGWCQWVPVTWPTGSVQVDPITGLTRHTPVVEGRKEGCL